MIINYYNEFNTGVQVSSVMAAVLEIIVAVSIFASCGFTLENGLVRTPPMGWLSWQRFRCITDCTDDPYNCISENLFMQMADIMASQGFKEAGYEYVSIDDCWFAQQRDANGRLQPDPQRFPSGMKSLSDYIHKRGLKFGIYADIGTKTCQNFPGSLFNLQMDVETFASWQVDMLKLDVCSLNIHDYGDGYPPVAMYLNMTGRPIALSCCYAIYQIDAGIMPDYVAQAKACNFGRNCHDIDDNWDSVMSIIECYGANAGNFSAVAGPGFFNDPDMLVIGNYGLSYDQERVQMAIWSIVAAPLLMSVDLRTIREESKALLLNKGAIAINQDPLGIQGQRVIKQGNIEIWSRQITPVGSYALAVLNLGTATPSKVSIVLSDIGLLNPGGYHMTEVFDDVYIGLFKPDSRLNVSVNPSGVFFGKASIISVRI